MNDEESVPELLEGKLRVTVVLDAKEYAWLKDLGDDLRGTFNDAVQLCIQAAMERGTLGRHKAIIKDFKDGLRVCDWKRLEDVLAQCTLLFQKEQLEEKIREGERKR